MPAIAKRVVQSARKLRRFDRGAGPHRYIRTETL
jgi:hypothetical protein